MNDLWYGCVEDRNDPLCLGRVRVRIWGINSPDKTVLPTSDLSWTPVRMPTTSASVSGVGLSPTGILPGTWVEVICIDIPDMQQWRVIGTIIGFDSQLGQPVDFGSTNVDGTTNNGSISTPAPQPVPQTPIPVPTQQQPNTSGWFLGQTSEFYETGGKGPGTISPLISNDKGGISFGSPQFASYLPLIMKNGQSRKGWQGSALQAYITSSSWSSRFTGLTPDQPAFSAVWKQIAAESSDDFETEQRNYIQVHFYNVMLNNLKRAGLDLTGFGPGVQDLVWSCAVQFGPNNKSIFLNPLANQSGLTDISIVNQVSAYKIATYPTYASRYQSEQSALLSLCNGAVVPVSKAEAKTIVPTPDTPPTNETTTGASQNNNGLIQATNTGFSDPTALYPTAEYNNLPDTNKLAYGVETGTQSADKTADRTIGAVLPNGATFDEPQNPYNAQYPFNKVLCTEGGHLIEIDDTPGSERINIYHKSGTFVEIDAIGNMVRKTVGSDFQFVDGNSYVSIDGKMNVSVGGTANIYVGADANIQVDGNTTMTCGNNVVVTAGGRMSFASAVAIDMKAPEIYIDADNSVDIKSGGTINVQSDDDYNLQSGGSIFEQASSNFNLLAGETMSVNGSGVVNILAGGALALDGATMALMSGIATPAFPAQPASLSQGVEPDGTTAYQEVIIPDVFTNKIFRIAAMAETPEEEGNVANVHTQLISSGLMTQADLAKPGVTSAVDTTPTPAPNNNTSPVSCAYISTLNGIPNTFQLSPNYTLADVSTKALAGSHQVIAQGGLSEQQIICNLYQIVNNVLEKIKQQWPDVKVNSGFRPLGPGQSPTSSHPKGEALDLHRDGLTAQGYLDWAVQVKALLNGNVDQIILESLPQGHNWLHIGFRAGNNRGMNFTMWQNRTYAQGFVLVQ